MNHLSKIVCLHKIRSSFRRIISLRIYSWYSKYDLSSFFSVGKTLISMSWYYKMMSILKELPNGSTFLFNFLKKESLSSIL